MMEMLGKMDVKKTGIFAAGVLFGTAGIKYYPVKMQRRHMFPAQRLYSGLRSVL